MIGMKTAMETGQVFFIWRPVSLLNSLCFKSYSSALSKFVHKRSILCSICLHFMPVHLKQICSRGHSLKSIHMWFDDLFPGIWNFFTTLDYYENGVGWLETIHRILRTVVHLDSGVQNWKLIFRNSKIQDLMQYSQYKSICVPVTVVCTGSHPLISAEIGVTRLLLHWVFQKTCKKYWPILRRLWRLIESHLQ